MKNTLSKLAAGVGVLTLAVSLTACGGSKLSTDEATCKEYRTQAEKIAGGSFTDISSSNLDEAKQKELFTKMVDVGKNSTAPVADSMVKLGEFGPKLFELQAKIKSDPTNTDILEELKKLQTPELKAAGDKVTEVCAPYMK